jgi:hypothetical protein
MRRGVIQVDENDIRILIIDHIDEPGAVRKLDGVDILPPQFLRQILAEDKILIDDEAQRISRLSRLGIERSGGWYVGHDWAQFATIKKS